MGGIAAGRLRHSVRIDQQVNVIDSSGFPETVWEPLRSKPFMVEIAPQSAREFVQSQQIQSEVRGRIVMRYNASVKPSMRVVHGSTYYDIFGIQRDPNSGIEWMTLVVSAGLEDDKPANA